MTPTKEENTGEGGGGRRTEAGGGSKGDEGGGKIPYNLETLDSTGTTLHEGTRGSRTDVTTTNNKQQQIKQINKQKQTKPEKKHNKTKERRTEENRAFELEQSSSGMRGKERTV